MALIFFMQKITLNNINSDVIFPQEAGNLIEAILKKYGLEESIEEIFDKVKNKKTSSTVLLAKLAKRMAQGIVSVKEVKILLKQNLNLKAADLNNLYQELESIALLAKQTKISEKKLSPETAEKKFHSSSIQKEKFKQADTYREPV